MVDPLGAAVGITALILQVSEDILKGYKFYKEAVNLPESHGYLRTRLQMEQQRFLNFCLEGRILYEDGVLCASLQLNRSLLVTILAEIKTLLEEYVKKNGKYEIYSGPGSMESSDHQETDTELESLIYQPHAQVGLGAAPNPLDEHRRLRGLRRWGQSIARASSNLRTIAMEPKRLVWVAVDKQSFENLVSKLEDLNTFLLALLDSASIRRMRESVHTSYLEILQIRNDIGSLTSLVQALSPPSISSSAAQNLYDGQMSQGVLEETEADLKTKSYLKQLVEIKIQYSNINWSSDSGERSNSPEVARTLLDPEHFGSDDLDWDGQEERTEATYQGRGVWLEWKGNASENESIQQTQISEDRVALLTNLLCYEKPRGFRAPRCLGYVRQEDGDDSANFGIVFSKPMETKTDWKLFTLKELLGLRSMPSLSSRISLCSVLALCLSSFHAVNWIHKGVRADNIIFFSPSVHQVDLSSPYVCGFELSRPSILNQMSEKPSFVPQQEIYRHPHAQYGTATGEYRKFQDIYSLGVVFLEIAYWKPIEDIIGIKDIDRARPFQLQVVQPRLLGKSFNANPTVPLPPTGGILCLDQVASNCGDGFRHIVEKCLTLDEDTKLLYPGESDPSVAMRLQASFEQIVKKLEHLMHALQ